jgi:hypothetical protein
VDPRTGLDAAERKFLPSSGLELRPLGRSARSQSLYRLSYPGSAIYITLAENSSGEVEGDPIKIYIVVILRICLLLHSADI